MNHYHINIFFSEEDEGYIADIPDLECCSAFGETPKQALAELEQPTEMSYMQILYSLPAKKPLRAASRE